MALENSGPSLNYSRVAVQDLLEAAKKIVLTPEEKEQQRRSFAYGNVAIENPRITREMVDRAADEIGPNYRDCSA